MTSLSFQWSDIKYAMTKGHLDKHAIPQFLMTIAKWRIGNEVRIQSEDSVNWRQFYCDFIMYDEKTLHIIKS